MQGQQPLTQRTTPKENRSAALVPASNRQMGGSCVRLMSKAAVLEGLLTIPCPTRTCNTQITGPGSSTLLA